MTGFDPATDAIFVDWFGPQAIEVDESDGNVVFIMAPYNQTVTLEGFTPSDLSASNFTLFHVPTEESSSVSVVMSLYRFSSVKYSKSW